VANREPPTKGHICRSIEHHQLAHAVRGTPDRLRRAYFSGLLRRNQRLPAFSIIARHFIKALRVPWHEDQITPQAGMPAPVWWAAKHTASILSSVGARRIQTGDRPTGTQLHGLFPGFADQMQIKFDTCGNLQMGPSSHKAVQSRKPLGAGLYRGPSPGGKHWLTSPTEMRG